MGNMCPRCFGPMLLALYARLSEVNIQTVVGNKGLVDALCRQLPRRRSATVQCSQQARGCSLRVLAAWRERSGVRDRHGACHTLHCMHSGSAAAGTTHRSSLTPRVTRRHSSSTTSREGIEEKRIPSKGGGGGGGEVSTLKSRGKRCRRASLHRCHWTTEWRRRTCRERPMCATDPLERAHAYSVCLLLPSTTVSFAANTLTTPSALSKIKTCSPRQ